MKLNFESNFMSIIKKTGMALLVLATAIGCNKNGDLPDRSGTQTVKKLVSSQVSITRWHPQTVIVGDKTDRRENGDLGVWFEQTGINSAADIEIWFGENKLNTQWFVKPNEVVTLDIPAKMISTPGIHKLFLKLPSSGQEIEIGMLEVKEGLGK